jgi:hypothetical protein
MRNKEKRINAATTITSEVFKKTKVYLIDRKLNYSYFVEGLIRCFHKNPDKFNDLDNEIKNIKEQIPYGEGY